MVKGGENIYFFINLKEKYEHLQVQAEIWIPYWGGEGNDGRERGERWKPRATEKTLLDSVTEKLNSCGLNSKTKDGNLKFALLKWSSRVISLKELGIDQPHIALEPEQRHVGLGEACPFQNNRLFLPCLQKTNDFIIVHNKFPFTFISINQFYIKRCDDKFNYFIEHTLNYFWHLIVLIEFLRQKVITVIIREIVNR